ncbi:MAG: glutamate racemase [Clostridia bacterium]|nr:glutamate racemase [Clostridia bacterium]
MDNRAIGIFDSGLGGLTCVKKVMEIMPDEDIIYFGDTGRVPYGTKSTETLVKYVKQDISFLESFDIKFIIIACGTASCAVLPNIQNEIKTDIIGVLNPTCRRAAELTQNGKIGVIGTQSTISCGNYARIIKDINPETEVISRACPMFVPLVENGYTSGQVARLIIEEYLTPIKEKGVDTLILGCTHYPLLREEIQRFMGDDVRLVNSGAEAAVEALGQLEIKGLRSGGRGRGCVRYYVSDTVDGFEKLGSVFLEQPIDGTVQKIEIEKY